MHLLSFFQICKFIFSQHNNSHKVQNSKGRKSLKMENPPFTSAHQPLSSPDDSEMSIHQYRHLASSLAPKRILYLLICAVFTAL